MRMHLDQCLVSGHLYGMLDYLVCFHVLKECQIPSHLNRNSHRLHHLHLHGWLRYVLMHFVLIGGLPMVKHNELLLDCRCQWSCALLHGGSMPLEPCSASAETFCARR